jgi:hypothetical protein
MRHRRGGIASYLGAMVFLAVGFVALREADRVWDRWLLSVTLVLLLAAVVLAALRAGARRAFWLGFALFGWGYFGLSRSPSTEPRLITTKALASLQSTLCVIRLNGVRVIPDLDRFHAHQLSIDDLLEATKEGGIKIGSPEYEQYRRRWRTIQSVGESFVLNLWHPRDITPEQWGGIVVKANAEGEILRLKDVARVERGPSSYAPRWVIVDPWSGSSQEFIHVGHTLITLSIALSGGVLFQRLWNILVMRRAPVHGD